MRDARRRSPRATLFRRVSRRPDTRNSKSTSSLITFRRTSSSDPMVVFGAIAFFRPPLLARSMARRVGHPRFCLQTALCSRSWAPSVPSSRALPVGSDDSRNPPLTEP
jgi:hypothetical protein